MTAAWLSVTRAGLSAHCCGSRRGRTVKVVSARLALMTVVTVPAQSTGGVLRVAVAGDVDVATAPALRAALEHATTRKPAWIEVDVAGVTHFSLAGLRALDDVRRHFGGTLVLLDAGRPVRRILDVLGLHDRFGLGGALPR